MNIEIDAGVPTFLRVDKAEAARRAAWNESHPLAAPTFSGVTEEQRSKLNEARARLKEEEHERERHLQAVRDQKREQSNTKTPPWQPMLPGMIWSMRYGKYVLPDFMSPAKYERLLSEMPTDDHRKAFIEIYGPGQGASLGAGGSPARATKDAKKVESTPAGASAKSRSAVRGAGRVRVPSGPRAPAEINLKPASTNKPPRATAVGDWKASVISMLRRPEGVTLTEIAKAHGWQEHSASARLTAIRKERNVVATVEERGRVYRTE